MDRVLLEEKINRLTAEDGRILARRESAVKWLRARLSAALRDGAGALPGLSDELWGQFRRGESAPGPLPQQMRRLVQGRIHPPGSATGLQLLRAEDATYGTAGKRQEHRKNRRMGPRLRPVEDGDAGRSHGSRTEVRRAGAQTGTEGPGKQEKPCLTRLFGIIYRKRFSL